VKLFVPLSFGLLAPAKKERRKERKEKEREKCDAPELSGLM